VADGRRSSSAPGARRGRGSAAARHIARDRRARIDPGGARACTCSARTGGSGLAAASSNALAMPRLSFGGFVASPATSAAIASASKENDESPSSRRAVSSITSHTSATVKCPPRCSPSRSGTPEPDPAGARAAPRARAPHSALLGRCEGLRSQLGVLRCQCSRALDVRGALYASGAHQCFRHLACRSAGAQRSPAGEA
jgi:hypothetical protein